MGAKEAGPLTRSTRKEQLEMIGEENKALVRLFDEEFWNKGNLAAADELIEASATVFLPGRGQGTREDLKAFAARWRDAFPDWHNTTDEIVAEGVRVAEWWMGRGTHQGEYQGMAPTRRPVAVSGTVFYRITSGKIIEFRGQFDVMALMQQLGTIPDHG
jgi:predicted ester cyclase